MSQIPSIRGSIIPDAFPRPVQPQKDRPQQQQPEQQPSQQSSESDLDETEEGGESHLDLKA